MAISVLDNGNSGAVATNATTTVPVTVSVGNGNRKLIIGVSLECTVAGVAPATVNFNGQDLVALGLEVPSTNQNPNSLARTVFYEQFEGGMPAPGVSNITVTWTGTSGGAGVFYWLVDGVRQDQVATGAGNNVLAAGAAGTTIGTTIAAAAAGAFLAAVAYKNNATGTLALTAPASSTSNGDLSVTGGARCAGYHKLGSLTVGSNTVTFTHDSQNRRCVSAIVVEPAPDTRTISGGFSTAPVTVSGDMDAVAQIGGGFSTGVTTVTGVVAHQPSTISGGFSTGPVTATGDVDAVAAISGAVALGPVLVSGDVTETTEANVSGGFTTSPITAGGTARILNRFVEGGFSTPPVTVHAEATSMIALSGGFTTGPVTVSGTVKAIASISGGLVLGAVTLTGAVQTLISKISGAITLGRVLVTGAVQSQHQGSVALWDQPAQTAELGHEDARFATLLDEPSGSVELGHE